VEQLEEEKGMETILPPKNNLIQNSEGNEGMDTQFWTPTK
jgi:hypothetical protein